MKILVTGGNGQLGTELGLVLGAAGDDVLIASSKELDVTDRDLVHQVLGGVRPDVVIHGGAWTNVDGCELDPSRAYLVNALGTRHVAEAATNVGARVVYVSTDYVFDGLGTGAHGGGAYTEWDTPNPVSVYGRSKLGGEHDLLAILGPDATIVRASWVVGQFGSNFVKTMLRVAADPSKDRVTVVDDQHGCPTFTADLAPMLRRLAVARVPGIFHVSNQGPTTWFGFAREIFSVAGYDPGRVVPIPSSELVPARPAPRPAWSVLDNVALRGGGFGELPHWDSSLAAAIDALRAS
jgi:dTDP-4-dehydrorhamnose reductase